MPELPDLQAFRRNLEKKFAGKKLVKINVLNPKKINIPAKALKSKLEGKKLKSISRDGKELFFHFDKDDVLSFHLMLKGQFHIFQKDNELRHKIIEFLFGNKSGLALTDWQKAANLKYNPPMPEVPDALSEKFDKKYFEAGINKYKSRRIKDLLIDQKFVRGIGNAYADEILWAAKIHPSSKSGKIPADKVKVLFKNITKVLLRAEKEIIKRDPDIIKGEIRDFLKVHNSRKKKSPAGADIKKENKSGRVTYYTNEQVLYQ